MTDVIRQLAHICIGTRNLDAALAFYEGVLAFKTVHEFRNGAGEKYGAFLHCGNRTFLEIFNDQTSAAEGGLYRHISFEVDDIAATVAALNRAGFNFEEPHRGRTDGVLLAMGKDPDGHIIEFQQYDEGSVQARFLSGEKAAHA